MDRLAAMSYSSETQFASIGMISNYKQTAMKNVSREIGRTPEPAFYGPSMLRALEVAQMCHDIEWYGVGCVITDRKGDIVSTGYTGERLDVDGGFKHAEEVAIEKALAGFSENENRGWILFSTMEPCSIRASGKTSCVTRILAARIPTVVYGAREPYDPALGVVCEGAKQLQISGVDTFWLKDFEKRCLLSVVSKRKLNK